MYEKLKTAMNNKESELESLPLSVAKIIRTDETLDFEQKKQAIELVKRWIQYVDEKSVDTSDLYVLRSHIESFAGTVSGVEQQEVNEEIGSVPVESISAPDERGAGEILGEITNPEILKDPRIIVYGGAARALLRAYGLQQGMGDEALFNAELPISDIDMMVVGSQDAAEIASKYGSDLSGIKIVQDAESEISKYFGSVDTTMNQVIVHDGELRFTQSALEDASNGLIRARGSEKPLFDRDSIALPNGEAYLLRSGFYRTLAMLLRGKGSEVVVSQENIDAEKENIGRYWLVLLFVKIFNMSDEGKKEEAVLQWYQVAKDISSTESASPEAFFTELTEKFPGFSYGKKDNDFDLEAQARWLIGKLVHRGQESVTGTKSFDEQSLPQSYTPANIILREYEGQSDLGEFWNTVEKYKNGAN
jgi:hypothetical protein